MHANLIVVILHVVCLRQFRFSFGIITCIAFSVRNVFDEFKVDLVCECC